MKILLDFLFILFYYAIKSNATDTKIASLWNSKACKNDINTHCNHEKGQKDSMLINCLERPNENIKAISVECQHFLWDFKVKYMNFEYFNFATNRHCENDFKLLKDCINEEKNEKVLCLIKNKKKVLNGVCLSELEEVSRILFSDIMVISKFINACHEIVKELKCGRLVNKHETFSTEKFISRITSQGKTIECLIDSLGKINGKCKKQILRMGELQSEDFHLNSNLYYSCEREREIFCGKLRSGKSRIYRCLESHKNHIKMSKECNKALSQKHKLETYDYKIRSYFSDKCAKDIYENKCALAENKDGEETHSLPSIIICLLKNQWKNTLSKECMTEIFNVRVQMAQNIEMFPEIPIHCDKEITGYCSTVNKTSDSVFYCLLQNSMPSLENNFNEKCIKSLKMFAKIVDPTEDIVQLDPVISQVCSRELETLCSFKLYMESSDRYQCLLESIDEDKGKVGQDCENHLLTLAKFIEQDYSLNHKLYKLCHKDAVAFCGAKNNSFENPSSIVAQAIIHCLIRKWNSRYINKEKSIFSYQCAVEVKSLMKIEASNLKMNFKIYAACTMDLMKFCRTVDFKMDCLQIHYGNLQNACKISIAEFLTLDSEEYSLKVLIARSCSPMVRKFCSEQSKETKNDYMKCLLNNKYDKEMDKNCFITLEHYQIIGLENYKIDHKFARFCSNEIKKHCSNLLMKSNQENEENDIDMDETTKPSTVSKSKIVGCLSKTLTLNLLKNTNPFSSQCYEQFTFEFLQQSSSLNLDPELRKICDSDINEKCHSRDDVLMCLQTYQDNLNKDCVDLLVSRQQLGALDTRFDVGIQRHCKEMIDLYCNKEHSHKVFRCLHKKIRVEGFNNECKKRIKLRLERRLVDLRLNPELLDYCKDEIKANCNVTINADKRIFEMDFTDKSQIIRCLRGVFVEHKKFLGSLCRRLVFNIVLDAQSDVHLDPGLYEICLDDIKGKCYKALVEDNVEANGKVLDCLKHNLLLQSLQSANCSKEVFRLLREGLSDIHVDPQLYSVCREEITRICFNERLGHGRKLSCLLWALEDKNTISFMSQSCKTVLQERKEMWEFATRMEAPKEFRQVLRLVSESDSRYYFLIIILSLVVFVLLIGISCGRYLNRNKKVVRKRR